MQAEQLQHLIEDLRAAGLDFSVDEPLSAHTTFKIGGPAAVFCRPERVVELVQVLELCRQHTVRVYLLGNGSNTLFADEGFQGAVVSLCGMRSHPVVHGGTVTVGAGMMLSQLCRLALAHSLTGLEFAYGIPGTVGGAVYMNAGAYGGEIKQVLSSVCILDENLHLQTVPAEELALGYRTSILETNNWCVLDATFQLAPGDAACIEARMQELLLSRREKQPLEWPSAGSTFKRPAGAFAGKLIEDCGLRGFTVGGAQISEKHCGFVINRGGATCADVVALTDHVREIVKKQTGYVLEREIRVVK
ncbi:MAG: UDP-N-acetylmuramate dehydrogenase [Gemmiger sp.]